MPTRTYAPKQVSVIIAGVSITGYAEDTFVSVEYSSDAFTKVVGASGEVARVASADETGEIVITLLQSSSDNDILTAIHTADRVSLTGKFSLIIKDNSGTSIYAASTAWIQKTAAAEYGAELGSREWTISCADLIALVGSNNA